MDDTSKKPQTFRALAAELKLPRKLLYTLDEVSRVLGVPYNTLRDECTARRLTYCLSRRSRRFTVIIGSKILSRCT